MFGIYAGLRIFLFESKYIFFRRLAIFVFGSIAYSKSHWCKPCSFVARVCGNANWMHYKIQHAYGASLNLPFIPKSIKMEQAINIMYRPYGRTVFFLYLIQMYVIVIYISRTSYLIILLFVRLWFRDSINIKLERLVEKIIWIWKWNSQFSLWFNGKTNLIANIQKNEEISIENVPSLLNLRKIIS